MKSNRCGTRSLLRLGTPAVVSMCAMRNRLVNSSHVCGYVKCKVKELHGCGTKAAAAFTRTKLLVGLPVSLK